MPKNIDGNVKGENSGNLDIRASIGYNTVTVKR